MAYIKNSAQALLYLKFRPLPPKDLTLKVIDFLFEKIPGPLVCALDVGCGSGQSTQILAPYFQRVIGIDNSKEQLEHAHGRKPPNVTYRWGIAEQLQEDDGSVDLVTAGMAIHWFNMQQFSDEVGRVLRPGGALAVYGYNLPGATVGTTCITDIVHWIFKDPLCQYIPEESKLAYLDGYKGNQFSKFIFSKEPTYRFEYMQEVQDACFEDLVGYITTTSAFQNYSLKHGDIEANKLLLEFRSKVAEHVGGTSYLEDKAFSILYPYFLLLSRKDIDEDK